MLTDPESQMSDASNRASLAKEGDLGLGIDIDLDITRTKRLADLVPLGVPMGDDQRERSKSRPVVSSVHSVKKARKQTSLVGVALLTFGVLATSMGIAFSFVSPPPAEPSTVYAWVDDGSIVVVGQARDGPADVQAVALTAPMLPGQAMMSAEAASQFRAQLNDAGVIARAKLPADARAKVAAVLPLAMGCVGLLALLLGVPAIFMSAGTWRWVLQLACATAVLGIGLYVIETGALAWPGRAAFQDVPRFTIPAP
jgi:hypothetical protein